MTELFVRLVKDSLNETTYQVRPCGVVLIPTTPGPALCVSGLHACACVGLLLFCTNQYTHTPKHTPQHPKKASIAELHYSCKATELGVELHFHGLSQRLLALVELVLGRLLDFGPHLEEVGGWVVSVGLVGVHWEEVGGVIIL